MRSLGPLRRLELFLGSAGNRGKAISCSEAREALSSRLDGEHCPVPVGALDAHVRACPDCHAFDESILSLRHDLALRVSRVAPVELGQALAPLLRDGAATRAIPAALTFAPFSTQSRLRLRSLGSLTKWVVPAVPVAAAAVLVPFGFSVHPHLVPTHLPSPCTIWLHKLRLR